jgi:transketolase
MPCLEWFAAQPDSYRDEVLPADVRARVSVEAACGQGWRDVVGDAGEIVSLEHFGASADGATLFREFGFTPEAVAAAARRSMDRVADGSAPPGGRRPAAAPTTGGPAA